MKKVIAFLFASLLLFSVGCAAKPAVIAETPLPQTPAPVSTPAPTPVPTPEVTPAPTAEPAAPDPDLAPLLSMTRKDVAALYGTSEPIPFADISDYNESGYPIPGFPCTYSKLGGVTVFYDAKPQAEDAAPYYCTEAPDDSVCGIMLSPDSTFNVNGALPVLDADILETLSKNYDAKVEHVNGMYEYYAVVVIEDNVQYEWESDSPDMSEATMYVRPADAG